MSGKVSGMVWELNIPHGHAWVLMSLADHAEHDGTQVFPGNGLTAWKTGYSVSQIKRILRDLIHQYGLIEPVVPGGGASRAEYRICIENFEGWKKEPMPSRGGQASNQNANKTNRGHNEPGSSDPSPVGSSTRAHDDRTVSIETSRRASASLDATDAIEHPFRFFCTLANAFDIIITPEDRTQTARHFKDLKRKHNPTYEEMQKLIAKMLEARTSGFDMSPQKALGKVRGTDPNLKVLRGGKQPASLEQMVSTAGYREFS
jgi:hypothetical protein